MAVRAKDLREKTDQELLDQLRMTRQQLFDATMRGASGEAIKPHEKRQGRRLIATLQTILRERALRRRLEGEIARLQPQAQSAGAWAAKAAAAPPDPRRPAARRRGRGDLAKADKAALELAELRRRLAALARPDPGETK